MKFTSTKDYHKVTMLFSNYLKIGYYSVWTFASILIIFPTRIIELLYSNEYVQGKVIFILYAIDAFVRFASMHLILIATGNQKKLMYYSLFALSLNIILNLILFKLLGLNGPALATVLVSITYSLLVLRKTTKTLNVKFKSIINIHDILKFVFCLIICGIVTKFIDIFLINLGANRFITMCIASLIFITGIFLTNYREIIVALKSLNKFNL